MDAVTLDKKRLKEFDDDNTIFTKDHIPLEPGEVEITRKYNIEQEQLAIIAKFKYNLGDNLLFFTVTLKPKYYKFQSVTQFDLSCNAITLLFERYGIQTVYTAELTKDGNVHYHAICQVAGAINRLTLIDKFKRSPIFGFAKLSPFIQTHEQLQRASAYLVKDLNITRRIISRNGWLPDIIKYM